ncbi:hypothetical protein [Algicola sagamiensis]|uniref:hypothetical protein n=1 Tax=Algicola sagamiensis TaxID=163869 RepID=UPI0012F996E5|nr:hypothetical protein [Algicola sagamiensis]
MMNSLHQNVKQLLIYLVAGAAGLYLVYLINPWFILYLIFYVILLFLDVPGTKTDKKIFGVRLKDIVWVIYTFPLFLMLLIGLYKLIMFMAGMSQIVLDVLS